MSQFLRDLNEAILALKRQKLHEMYNELTTQQMAVFNSAFGKIDNLEGTRLDSAIGLVERTIFINQIKDVDGK